LLNWSTGLAAQCRVAGLYAVASVAVLAGGVIRRVDALVTVGFAIRIKLDIAFLASVDRALDTVGAVQGSVLAATYGVLVGVARGVSLVTGVDRTPRHIRAIRRRSGYASRTALKKSLGTRRPGWRRGAPNIFDATFARSGQRAGLLAVAEQTVVALRIVRGVDTLVAIRLAEAVHGGITLGARAHGAVA